ncbi:MAG: hypothetical protein OXM62_06375 [bacterium]|nr:hypothetical protein [bacterium]MDE0234616.1 hypothetical protein [bacterium]
MLIKRAISVYLALVAICLVVQFTFWTIYAQASERASDVAGAVWDVIGWCMLAGLVLVVVVTYREKQGDHPDSSAGARQWLTANRLFYAALVLTLAFLPNWFAARWGEPPNDATFWMVWYVIDTVTPVVFGVTAIRLWRTVSD